MSGIAELLINLGFNVSGSDLIESELTDKLKRKMQQFTTHISKKRS